MSESNYDKLVLLFKESHNATIAREQNEFNQYADRIAEKGLVLFGAGGFGKRTLLGLHRLGIEPLCFTDNNQSLWNRYIEDKRVVSPSEAVKKYPEALFMVTIWSDVIGHPVNEIESLLKSFNSHISVVSFFSLYWKYPETFLPYFGIDLPHKTSYESGLIIQANKLWSDSRSRNEYLAQLRWRLWFDYNGLPQPETYKQYFPADLFRISPNEVFIDCGAFDGDTLKNFLTESREDFDCYIAFEPDPSNFSNLENGISKLDERLKSKILTYKLALSDFAKKIKFKADGTLQSSESFDGNVEVECVSLDDKFYEFKPSYIKIDAEGAEPEIIEGAKKIIKDYSPIIAVSVYHEYNHMWTLPLKIHEINKSYRYYLRPHCKACWDLVCYAVPEARII